MKYIINSKNTKVLSQADIIMVAWKDRADILDLAHDYNKEIILEAPTDLKTKEKEILKLVNNANGKLTLCVNTIIDGAWALNHNINFYFNSYLKTFTELNGAIQLGAKYVMLDVPLFHKYDLVKSKIKDKAEIIFLPNKAKLDVFDVSDGACGPYIRPEDGDLYEGYAYFGNVSAEKEETLIRLYKDDKHWTGKMFMIIDDLGDNYSESLNRLVVPEGDFGKARQNCGMACMATSRCRLCYTALKVAGMKDELKNIVEVK